MILFKDMIYNIATDAFVKTLVFGKYYRPHPFKVGNFYNGKTCLFNFKFAKNSHGISDPALVKA